MIRPTPHLPTLFADVLDAPAVSRITPREREILELVACGLTNHAIAARLSIAPGTVKKHLDNCYEKLGHGKRRQAAALVLGASSPA